MLCAMIQHISEPSVVRLLAEGIVRRTLMNDTEMRLIMPPLMASMVPMESIPSERIMDFINQSRL
jgi:hypothetical protein